MAEKGNAMAYQALRPLPTLRVADLANSIITRFERDQAAKEEARLKRLAEERKSIGEYFDKINVKSFATIPNFTDQASKLYTDTVDYIGEMGLMAQKNPEKRYQYQSLAKKAEANYNALQASFGSEKFIEAANDKLKAYDSGDYFMDSDTKEKLELIKNGMIQMQLDRSTGEYKFAIPRNNNSKPDEDAKWYTAGEVQSWYTTPEELDWMNPTSANKGETFPKELGAIAKNFADEYSSNTDGNVTVESKTFAKERAQAWFDNKYGSYKAGQVDPRINQFAKMTFKDEIDSEEEYNRAKDAVIDYIGSQIATETKRDTKYTALDLKEKKANIAYKQKATAELGKENIKEPKFDITPGNSIMQIDGSGKGRLIDGVTLINLNNKEYIAAYKTPNSNGKGFHSRYAIVGRDEQGRMAFKENTTRGDVAVRMAGYNLDPIMIDGSIRSSTPAKFNKWQKTTSKKLRSFNQASEEKQDFPIPVYNVGNNQFNNP
ncbi:hypothetical protein [uncultured Chryseobacterium sp.]|uniref:hypothetical protein n=1 Tax=uncultured Chryseobacterium sp. TaxID=259322 RepID=UPI0025D14815|nr:hypothetical protein [uncultured Chryseobacterium sp.]